MNLRDIIFANLKLKLLSLLFAVVLWLFVALETSDEAEVPLVLKPVNIPAGLTVSQEAFPSLQLLVAGSRTLIIRQRLKGAYVELDLSKAVAGVVTFSGLEHHVRLVPGLSAASVTPATVKVELMDSSSIDKSR